MNGQADAAGHDELLSLLVDIFELERQDRDKRRVDRLRHASKLPPGKTFDTFQQGQLPKILAGKLRELARGDFLQRAVNVLAFGLPGTGKSHAACAIGHALIEAGQCRRGFDFLDHPLTPCTLPPAPSPRDAWQACERKKEPGNDRSGGAGRVPGR